MTQTCNFWVKWIALETNQTYESQICENNSKIDYKTNNNQFYPITIHYNKHAIKLNNPIIIRPIGKTWGCRGQKIDGWCRKIKSRAIF